MRGAGLEEGNGGTGFTAHRLLIEGTVETPIELGEHQGSALRGALFQALRGRPDRPAFCLHPRLECRSCPVLTSCPVSTLLAPVDEEGRRGGDVPRPYTIEPPLGSSGRYGQGDRLSFGLTVFGRAVSLFPYVVVGTRRLEEEGIGRRVANGGGWRPGRFRIERIVAANPITEERQGVLQRGEELVKVPAVPVRHEHVMTRARALESCKGRLRVEFLTPTRLIEGGASLRRPDFRVLVHRLLERLSSLWEAYARRDLPVDFEGLMRAAERVRLVDDETRWVSLRGYSTRQDAPKYLDGFAGRATYEGEWEALLPWLIWGEVTHAGKDAVKGCGLYRMAREE